MVKSSSSSDPVKLKFVDSVHEQREQNNKLIPIKGCWLELGKFEPVVERFDIKERWRCVATGEEGEGDEMTLWADLELMDYEAMQARSLSLADQIIEKHGQKLVDSLRLVLVRGLFDRFGKIDEKRKEMVRASAACAGDRKKKDGYLSYRDLQDRLRLAKEDVAETQAKMEKMKKELGGIVHEAGSEEDSARGAQGERPVVSAD
jgi:hypothetical protein